jgi:hypothetical protein
MSDYSEAGEEFLEHYGVLGMKWGVRKDRYGPTPKADAVRAVIGGPALAPKSTGRTAGRVVNKVNARSAKSVGNQASQTKSQKAKTIQRKKQGEIATRVALTAYIGGISSYAVGPAGGLAVGVVRSNTTVNAYKEQTGTRTPTQKMSKSAKIKQVRDTGKKATKTLLRR